MTLKRIATTVKFISSVLFKITSIMVIAICLYFMLENRFINKMASSKTYEEYIPDDDDMTSYEELRKLNSEVIGWIKINDTSINYPIVQAQDNKKYLTTNPFNQYSSCGSIFVDCECKKDFSGFNTIIYGHHMANGMMFGDISKYENADYFNAHKKGTIYIGDKKYRLSLFAFLDNVDGYDGHIYKVVEESKEEAADYLNYLERKSKFFEKIKNTDNVILLSTCSGYDTNGRLILVGKRQ